MPRGFKDGSDSCLNLAQLGITTDVDETSATFGQLLVDGSALASALAADPEGVAMLMARKPVLVVVAGNDEAVVGLDRKVAPLADGKRVQMKVVAGAGHFFRDLFADDAVAAIDAFLKGVGY